MHDRFRRLAPRLLLFAVFIAAVALFYAFGGAHWLNLERLLNERRTLQTLVRTHYATALLLAGLAYVLMVSLSIPAGTLFSLLIGFLFGLWVGGALITVSATIGAAVIFLIVRYLIGAAARRRLEHHPQAQKLLAGFEHNAFNYLLFVRLVPLFPFWLVNLASAFTAMRLREYVLGTFIGILPGCFIYANLGRQLGSIHSLHGLVSLPVLGALALLGLFALVPIVVRRVRA